MVVGRRNLQIDQLAFEMHVDFIKLKKKRKVMEGYLNMGRKRGMLQRCRKGWSEPK